MTGKLWDFSRMFLRVRKGKFIKIRFRTMMVGKEKKKLFIF